MSFRRTSNPQNAVSSSNYEYATALGDSFMKGPYNNQRENFRVYSKRNISVGGSLQSSGIHQVSNWSHTQRKQGDSVNPELSSWTSGKSVEKRKYQDIMGGGSWNCWFKSLNEREWVQAIKTKRIEVKKKPVMGMQKGKLLLIRPDWAGFLQSNVESNPVF